MQLNRIHRNVSPGCLPHQQTVPLTCPAAIMPMNAKSFIADTPVTLNPRLVGDDEKNPPQRPGGDTLITAKPAQRTKKPSMYKVLLLNDDYTPMEFVITILERYFNKQAEDATRIMLHVHQNGVGICGVYTFEVAETKVTQVMDFARQNQHPLQCTMEKD